MQKIDKFAHAAKVAAMCLPPVIVSLIGLVALSRRKGGTTLARRPVPAAPAKGRG